MFGAIVLTLSASGFSLQYAGLSRRDAVALGAAAAFGAATPAFAEVKDDVALLMNEKRNVGDTGAYVLSTKVVAKGASSTAIMLTAPPSSSLSDDVMPLHLHTPVPGL